jgi:hypothetical protein
LLRRPLCGSRSEAESVTLHATNDDNYEVRLVCAAITAWRHERWEHIRGPVCRPGPTTT